MLFRLYLCVAIFGALCVLSIHGEGTATGNGVNVTPSTEENGNAVAEPVAEAADEAGTAAEVAAAAAAQAAIVEMAASLKHAAEVTHDASNKMDTAVTQTEAEEKESAVETALTLAQAAAAELGEVLAKAADAKKAVDVKKDGEAFKTTVDSLVGCILSGGHFNIKTGTALRNYGCFCREDGKHANIKLANVVEPDDIDRVCNVYTKCMKLITRMNQGRRIDGRTYEPCPLYFTKDFCDDHFSDDQAEARACRECDAKQVPRLYDALLSMKPTEEDVKDWVLPHKECIVN